MQRNVLVFILMLLCGVSKAEHHASNIRTISTYEGLSSSYAFQTTQDHYGRLWIATEWGLNCYDGNQIKNYTHQPADSTSLSTNFVWALHADRERGELWIATENGLNQYDFYNDRFVRYEQFSTGCIDVIPADSTHLWLSNYQYGLIRFDKEQGTCTPIEAVYNAVQPIGKGTLRAWKLFDDRQGSIWIGTDKMGIVRYAPSAQVAEHYHLYDSSGEVEQKVFVRSFFKDRHNILWAVTFSGLYYADLSQPKPVFRQSELLKNVSLSTITLLDNGMLWLSGEKGIYTFPYEYLHPHTKKTPIHLTTVASQGNTTSLSSIRHIYQDDYDNLWLSSYTGGVIFIASKPDRFKPLDIMVDGEPVYPYKPLCITEDEEGRLYVGTEGMGIYYQTGPDEWRQLIFGDDSLRAMRNFIQSIYVGRDRIWAGTYLNGLYCYHIPTGLWEQFTPQNSLLAGDEIRAIRAQGDSVWVGSNEGLTLFSSDGRLLQAYHYAAHQFNGDIRDIEPMPDGNLWMLSYKNGLNHLDTKSTTFTIYRNSSERNSLPSNDINDIHVGDTSIVYLLTQDGGVYQSHHGNYRKIEALSTGFPCLRIFVDGQNLLWLSHIKGIQSYNPANQIVESYTDDPIRRIGTFYASIGLQTKSGDIYFGGSNGIVQFTPHEVVRSESNTPRPIFTRFDLANQQLNIHTAESPSPLKADIITTPSIVLPARQSHFTIHYGNTDFGNPHVKYAFQLEGEDSKWNFVGERTFAEYRNLKPGRYTFRVATTITDQEPSDESVASLRITITPPFWQTTLMVCFYVITSILLIAAVFHLYTKRINQKNQEKLAAVQQAQREALYQAKLQFFTNISHEFRTPLTLIASPIQDLLEHEQRGDHRFLLTVIKRNADRLLSLINQILDIRKLDQQGYHLSVSEYDIVHTIRETSDSFSQLSAQKGITFTHDFSEPSRTMFFDKELVVKCVVNILSNAFKYTPHGGHITIRLQPEPVPQPLWYTIAISDTGIGIPEQDIHRVFERFYQASSSHTATATTGSGIGLHLVKQLIERHHGKITVHSTPNVGTTFTLYLPLSLDVFDRGDIIFISSADTSDFSLATMSDDNSSAPFPSHGSYTVMVVDDDADIRDYLRYCLAADYRVITCGSGVDALDMLRSDEQVDLIISDIMMPQMDGYTFLQQIKENISTNHIPVILLTAKAGITSQIEGYATGADAYLPKPFDKELLLTIVASILKRQEALRRKYTAYLHHPHQDDAPCESAPCEDSLFATADQFVRRAIDIVEQAMDNPDFNGEQLAEQLCISRVHLHRKLRSLLDMSTSDFIRRIRLHRAAELLIKGSLSISEICYDTGFNSPSYFSTCFAKLYGCTPREYQASQMNRRGEPIVDR